MDLIQYKGPFYRNQVIEVPAEPGYTYVHIGIQVPKRQPIGVPVTRVSEDGKTTTETGEWRPFNHGSATSPSYGQEPIVQINGEQYQLSQADILEFDGLSEVSWTIRFLKTLPAESIIDIVRKT